MAKVILVVDDEPVIVEISRRKLEQHGYTVLTASDGEEALEIVKKQRPDLILLDVQMPKMNGYTFLMEYHKLPDAMSVPVIVLTAYGEMEPLFRRHNIKDYVLKPLQLQDMLDKIKTVLGE